MIECCFGMFCCVNWARLGELSAWSELELCKSRPSESISPKRELQSLIFGSGTRISPRRLWTGLSDLVSCSSERHSPKRGREETWMFWVRLLAQARGFGVLSDRYARLGEKGSHKRGLDECWWLFDCIIVYARCVLFWVRVWLTPARGSRLSEITWWCYCFKLAQARWASLSETEGLAWARVPGLSEFMRIAMLCVLACVGLTSLS